LSINKNYLVNEFRRESKINHRVHLPGFPGRLRLRLLPAAGGALGPPEAEEVRLELDMLLLS
jgi:hypothetical protein